jgi:cyclic-di-AMP phosphodiesterase PgpH
MGKDTLFSKLTEDKAGNRDFDPKNPRYSFNIRIIILIGTIILCSLFFNIHIEQKQAESSIYNLVPGYIWSGQTLIADFTFPIYKSYDKYIEEKEKASNKALDVYVYDEKADELSTVKLNNIIKKLPFIETQSSDPIIENFSEKVLKPFTELSSAQRNTFLNDVSKVIKKIMEKSLEDGLLNVPKENIKKAEVTIRRLPNIEFTVLTQKITDSSSTIEYARNVFSEYFSTSLTQLAVEILTKVITPNLIYSHNLSIQAKDIAEKSVPRTIGIVRKGDVIIEKNERVTKDHILKLQSYESSQYMKGDKIYSIWIFLGTVGHATLIYSFLILYLIFIRKRIFYDNYQLGILSLILVFVAAQSWLSLQIITKLPIEYIIMLPACSMLVAIVFDSRTAFYTTVTMALMLAGIRGNDYETGTAMMIAGTLAAYTVRDIKSRTQMYQSFFYIMIGFLATIVSFGLERSVDIIFSLNKLLMALLNSAISPLITFGLLFILERVTNIATDLRIKEFDNLNHPLLIKLSELAPGTYQHTLALASLAERCANAIGANTLLCRVGAYFHDIGKMEKPEYYVENQPDMESKHDLISPRKSAAAIKAHVISGIELGKQYKLPQRILELIPMHHGTSLIKHFYIKALEEGKGPVDDSDYRYPGPKPNTREAAIIMLCDAAEAMSHLITKDKEDFENTLENLIMERIHDGQFDNCDISLREIKIIEETCVKNLIGLSHQRIIYKEMPRMIEEDRSQDDN